MLLLVCVLLLSMRLADAQPAPSQAQAYMRVIQDNGVWWFQDGTGRTFFSLGVNCVGGCYGHAEATPMLPARRQWIVALLHDWGFNTAGCWSSPSVWPDFAVAEQLYVDVRPQAQDVFDAAFWQGPFADHLREEVKPFRGQPNVLGIQTLYMYLSGIAVTGFTTVILLLLIIGSAIMISLGIIGIYISKIFDEVKGRPRFIVAETVHAREAARVAGLTSPRAPSP